MEDTHESCAQNNEDAVDRKAPVNSGFTRPLVFSVLTRGLEAAAHDSIKFLYPSRDHKRQQVELQEGRTWKSMSIRLQRQTEKIADTEADTSSNTRNGCAKTVSLVNTVPRNKLQDLR